MLESGSHLLDKSTGSNEGNFNVSRGFFFIWIRAHGLQKVQLPMAKASRMRNTRLRLLCVDNNLKVPGSSCSRFSKTHDCTIRHKTLALYLCRLYISVVHDGQQSIQRYIYSLQLNRKFGLWEQPGKIDPHHLQLQTMSQVMKR